MKGDAYLIAGSHDPSLAIVDAQSLSGPTFTVLAGYAPIGCGGVLLVWPGVGEAWTIVNAHILRYPYVHRLVTRALRTLMQEHALHRIGAWALADQRRHRRWLEVLGFTYEGIARKFTSDGQDVARYALFRKD